MSKRQAGFVVVGLGLFALASACREQKATTTADASSLDSAVATGVPKSVQGLEGDVVLTDPAASGRLVIGYRTAEEQREMDAGDFSMKTAREMIGRWKIVDDIVDFAKMPRVHYKIDDAPADGTAVAVLDVDHDFWPTIFGGGKGKIGWSKPGGGEVKIAAAAHAPSADAGAADPCSGPRFKLIEVAIPPLLAAAKANAPNVTPSKVGGSSRRFCAYLPASYDSQPTHRYPVIFLLPGFLSTDMAYLKGQGNAGSRTDKISADLGGAAHEVILVGVDTSSPLGSTYLEDSPVTGPWDSFMVKRALPEIDRTLRTIPKRTARAVIGQSTGGFNALSFGMRHSDLISIIGASSPDAPDMEAWLIDPSTATANAKTGGSPRRVNEWLRKWTKLEGEMGGPGQMTSYAADFSESLVAVNANALGKDGRSFLIAWPFDLESGIVDDMVLSQWIAKTPHGFLKDPKVVARLKQDLSDRILITVGKKDEFDLFPPAERFAKELNDTGIKTQFVPTDHGHGNGLDRLESGIKFALDRF